jgi:hypothetical protein
VSELPPPVTEARFRELEGATAEQVQRRAAPFVRELLSFLNEGSSLHDIQSVRLRWKLRTGSVRAFKTFVPQREHWYTYNAGGRNESQFNVGMFPGYLRVGLGFEFTKGAHGKPDELVEPVYERFCGILQQRRAGFDRFARENSLMVEWRRAGERELEYVPTEEVLEWLLSSPDPREWVFVGRLLCRSRDAAVLEDPARLKEAMEAVFEGLKPVWQQAQTRAARNRDPQ